MDCSISKGLNRHQLMGNSWCLVMILKICAMQGKDSLFLGPPRQSRKQSQPLCLSVLAEREETAEKVMERVLRLLEASFRELQVTSPKHGVYVDSPSLVYTIYT